MAIKHNSSIDTKAAWRIVSQSTVCSTLLAALRAEEEALRTIYETQPANEYNRGRLLGLQRVITLIEGA